MGKPAATDRHCLPSLSHSFTLDTLDLDTIVATVDKPNVTSIRALEMLGVSVTGEQRVHGNPIVYYAVSPQRLRAVPGTYSSVELAAEAWQGNGYRGREGTT
jgi:hypothetical protein